MRGEKVTEEVIRFGLKGLCSRRGRFSTVTFISDSCFEWLREYRQVQLQPLVVMESVVAGQVWEADSIRGSFSKISNMLGCCWRARHWSSMPPVLDVIIGSF